MAAGRLDSVQVCLLPLRDGTGDPHVDQVRVRDDRGERGAELVAHVGKELRLGAVRRLCLVGQLLLPQRGQHEPLVGRRCPPGERPGVVERPLRDPARGLCLGVEPGVVDGHRAAPGEVFGHQAIGVPGAMPLSRGGEGDGTDHPATGDHRHREKRFGTHLGQERPVLGVAMVAR
ncbi:MAG TPA: hypothetical protein VEY93_07350 [Longimicrobium sp.]|nr:hypothetical protein [Longimicrobium sp.]